MEERNEKGTEEKIIVELNDDFTLIIKDPKKWRSLFDKGYYGFPDEKKKILRLSPYEALLLLERGKIEIVKDSEKISLKEFIRIFTNRIKDFWENYLVFSDIRRRGYVVKEGISQEIIFSVYPRGENPQEAPPKYYVIKVYEGTPLKLDALRESTKISRVSKKTLLIAVLDRQGDVTYYKTSRLDF